MQPFGSITIRDMGFFFGMKTTKIDDFFIMRNLSLPTFSCILQKRDVAYSLQSRFITTLAICAIFTMSCFTQIYKTIVSSMSVNVINLLSRHCASHIKPCESMRSIMLSIYFKIYISSMVQISRPPAHFYSWTRRIPKQKSCFWIISENFGKFDMGKHLNILPGCELNCNAERGSL